MHFVVDASTKKEANIAAGSTVTVMYHNDATKHVATDVKAAPPRPRSGQEVS